nr:immunoglobulin light chain junction region [Macaca mulatta]
DYYCRVYDDSDVLF